MSSRDYEHKVVVITGASAGIGAAAAVEIGRRGGAVVLAARRHEPLAAVAAQLGEAALAVPTDVTERAQVQRLCAAALERFGRIDIWINNAGRGISRDVAALDDDDVDAMMRDNLKSALYGIQAVLPHLQQRGDGAIVNVSSMLGRVPFASFRSAYSMSKAALNALSDNLRVELARSHPAIRVVTLLPGPVATEFGANALGGGVDSRALPGAQSAEEVARMLADAALTRRGDVYTMPPGLSIAQGHLTQLAAQ